MTVAEFKALFPEFVAAPDALVTSRLAWATTRTPSDVWGLYQDQGIAFLAAHFLALLPNGKEMRKGERPGESMYGAERLRLERIVASGFRVAGLPSASLAAALASWRAYLL